MLPSGICPLCIYLFCLPRALSLGLSLFLMNCTISEFIQCRWWQFDKIINNLDQVQLEWANGHLTLSHTWFYWQDHYASLIMCLKASSSPWMSKWSTISSFVATAPVVQEFPIQALPVSNYIHRVFVCTILSGKTTLLLQFYLAQYNFVKVGIPISALYCPSSLFSSSLGSFLWHIQQVACISSMNPWQHHTGSLKPARSSPFHGKQEKMWWFMLKHG